MEQSEVEDIDLVEEMDFIEPSNKKEVNDFFAGYLSLKEKDISFLDLFALFEEDFFLFLSIFAGREIKIPPLNKLERYQKRVLIYLLLQDNSSEEVARMFDDESATTINGHKAKVVDSLESFDDNDFCFDDSRFVKGLEKYKEDVLNGKEKLNQFAEKKNS